VNPVSQAISWIENRPAGHDRPAPLHRTMSSSRCRPLAPSMVPWTISTHAAADGISRRLMPGASGRCSNCYQARYSWCRSGPRRLSWLKDTYKDGVDSFWTQTAPTWARRWKTMIEGFDARRALRAFEAATLSAVRQGMRNGASQAVPKHGRGGRRQRTRRAVLHTRVTGRSERVRNCCWTESMYDPLMTLVMP
jgi:hypothetical protein